MGKFNEAKQFNAMNCGKDSIGPGGDSRVKKARPPKQRHKLKPSTKGFG